MLQRASSAIEPGKHIPAVLPSRPGAPQLLGGSMGLPFGESAAAVQIQGLFNQTTKEYNVVRRFRNPLAESVKRLAESSDIRQKHIQRPKSSKGLTGSGSSSAGSLSQTYRESAAQSPSNAHRQNTNSSQTTASSNKTDKVRLSTLIVVELVSIYLDDQLHKTRMMTSKVVKQRALAATTDVYVTVHMRYADECGHWTTVEEV